MFLHAALARIERVAGQLQGKGWGASTNSREVAQILKHVSDPKTVLDVGGNVGTWTESLLKQSPNATVYIFEPSLINVNCLREKFKAASNVHVVLQALSDRDGEQLLFSDEAGSGIASLHQRDLSHFKISYETSEKVSLVSFKSFMQREKIEQIDILKLDIEGHEFQVLHSLTSAELAKVGLIQFEFGGLQH
jgi:FkbM family methyltransferase